MVKNAKSPVSHPKTDTKIHVGHASIAKTWNPDPLKLVENNESF